MQHGARTRKRQVTNMTDAYDYDALAYDLYREADDLIEKLVAVRDARGMSVEDLAEEMNVDAATLIGVEDGSVEPTLQLLVDYALESGAMLHVQVEQAPSGKSSSYSFSRRTESAVCAAEWGNGDIAVIDTFVPVNERNETPTKMHIISQGTQQAYVVSTARDMNTTEAATC